jgi:hypothetical protein
MYQLQSTPVADLHYLEPFLLEQSEGFRASPLLKPDMVPSNFTIQIIKKPPSSAQPNSASRTTISGRRRKNDPCYDRFVSELMRDDFSHCGLLPSEEYDDDEGTEGEDTIYELKAPMSEDLDNNCNIPVKEIFDLFEEEYLFKLRDRDVIERMRRRIEYIQDSSAYGFGQDEQQRLSDQIMDFQSSLHNDILNPSSEHTLMPRWAAVEDRLLLIGLKKYGLNSWELIRHGLLPSKSVKQIQIRYKNLTSRRTPNNIVKEFCVELMKPLSEVEEDLLYRVFLVCADWNCRVFANLARNSTASPPIICRIDRLPF